MHRFLKRLLWVSTTLGLGALAYALMRTEGERVLRATARKRGGEAVGPPRCAAVTKSGSRCGREPQPASEYCWQHG